MSSSDIRIKLGCRFDLSLQQPTPMIALLNVHFSRASDLEFPDHLRSVPLVPLSAYRDGFGNWCTRLVAPAGAFSIGAEAIIADSGLPDARPPEGGQVAVEALPDEALVFLLGSRYCETDVLSDIAWRLFEHTPPGSARVQAICDFVHRHIRFDYLAARATRSAAQAYAETQGVCRDYAHLAIAFCRCMNIPARYCTGYLGDIGIPPVDAPMDFSAWFDVYIDGAWYTHDARHNRPRIGRILMARGRDATDVALTTAFGPATLIRFEVHTDEVSSIS